MFRSASQLFHLADRLIIGAGLAITTLALIQAGRLMALPTHFL